MSFLLPWFLCISRLIENRMPNSKKLHSVSVFILGKQNTLIPTGQQQTYGSKKDTHPRISVK